MFLQKSPDSRTRFVAAIGISFSAIVLAGCSGNTAQRNIDDHPSPALSQQPVITPPIETYKPPVVAKIANLGKVSLLADSYFQSPGDKPDTLSAANTTRIIEIDQDGGAKFKNWDRALNYPGRYDSTFIPLEGKFDCDVSESAKNSVANDAISTAPRNSLVLRVEWTPEHTSGEYIMENNSKLCKDDNSFSANDMTALAKIVGATG